MSSRILTPTPLRSHQRTRRGDTLIEIMFAMAVFALVAVISISAMNLGTATAENALEVVTARNELNAQAEALRFVHSSYISERTLPLRSDLTSQQISSGEKYQQYADLWSTIVSNAITPTEASEAGFFNLADSANNNNPITTNGCARMYSPTPSGETLLSRVNAFILNPRDLSSRNAAGNFDVSLSYVGAKSQPEVFREAELNARIIYTADTSLSTEDSDSQLHEGDILQGTIYDRVRWAEGIWVVAVSDGTSNNPAASAYYDFHIQTCWYGPNTTSPTTLDTIIRLYNPEGTDVLPQP